MSRPPWTNKAISLLGVHEVPGRSDNPVILEWARVCGGRIAKTYVHDDIAWCALFANYCLASTGFQGDDSLWALDFAKWGQKLDGPAVGALLSMKREGGGHVTIVVGRDEDGNLVCVGGNVSDKVSRQAVDSARVVSLNWPAGYPAPQTGLAALPLVGPLSPADAEPIDAPAQATAAGPPHGLVAGISQDAFDFIVRKEVTSQAEYERTLRRPTWPKGESGVTIGVGYDLGWATAEQLRADWGGKLPDAAIAALAPALGVRGGAAKAVADQLHHVDVPWDAAISVFRDVVLPRWVGTVRKVLPNVDQLSPDSLGALVSLTYNRGPSFAADGERYREMRAIRAHMEARAFEKIPDEIRSMKRLWPESRGLRARRDEEADLFARGLVAAPAKPPPVAKPTEVTTIAAGAALAPVLLWISQKPILIGFAAAALIDLARIAIRAAMARNQGVPDMSNTYPPAPDGTVRAEIKSAWSSKINWTQIVTVIPGLITTATALAGGLPPEYGVVIVGGLQAVQGIVTWVQRTWFTTTITPSSAAK